MFKDLERLVALNTSKMSEDTKKEAIWILKDMFYFAQSTKILLERDEYRALLFGINCDLKHLTGGIIFSGHIDTVPGEKEYSFDEICFYGRGTSDMKSFFSCLKKVFESLDLNLISIPIVLAISFDEETNNKSMKAINKYFLKNKYIPKYCIVGEPTLSSCPLFNYGCYDITITISGNEHHIGSEQEYDCFDVLLKTMNLLEALKKKYHETIIKITFVHGGEVLNVSPAECKLGLQIRAKNYKYVKLICEELTTILQNNNIPLAVKKNNTDLPPFQNFESYLSTIISEYNNEKFCTFLATTEAGGFQEIGIDTVICGPGDIRLAHTKNESILYSNMDEYVQLLIKVLKKLNQAYHG